MNFCRKCGAPVGVADTSERPTAIFAEPGPVQTQRLDPRPTSSGSDVQGPVPVGGFAALVYGKAGTPPPGPRRGLIIVGILLVALLGIGTGLVKYIIMPRVQVRSSTSKQAEHPDHKALIYPGARTVLDVTSGTGAGVLQLQTNDDLDKVADWYLEHLKPTKTVRVGSMVILRTGNTTLTIVSDSGSTNIMIKQTP